jgi:hypothetical protein
LLLQDVPDVLFHCGPRRSGDDPRGPRLVNDDPTPRAGPDDDGHPTASHHSADADRPSLSISDLVARDEPDRHETQRHEPQRHDTDHHALHRHDDDAPQPHRPSLAETTGELLLRRDPDLLAAPEQAHARAVTRRNVLVASVGFIVLGIAILLLADPSHTPVAVPIVLIVAGLLGGALAVVLRRASQADRDAQNGWH